MPRLLTSRKVKRGTVSFGERVFDRKTSKAREARVYFYFPLASIAGTLNPITRPHSLGRVPTTYNVVARRCDVAIGPPGEIFDVFPFATETHITLHCTTDNTMAEIVVR